MEPARLPDAPAPGKGLMLFLAGEYSTTHCNF